MMTPVQLLLRWLLLWGGLTTSNIASAGVRQEPLPGVTIGYVALAPAANLYDVPVTPPQEDNPDSRPSNASHLGYSLNYLPQRREDGCFPKLAEVLRSKGGGLLSMLWSDWHRGRPKLSAKQD